MKPHVAVIAAVALIALAGSAAWCLASPPPPPPEAEQISIALPPSENSALFYIAQDLHYFSENGCAVTIRTYDPPAAGVRAMLSGEVDLAGASEYPVVLNALQGENLSVIVRDDLTRSIYVIGRKDRGIADASDLRGKTIGAAKGTIAEFYLGRFLALRGIEPGGVKPVDVQPPEFVDALATGEIDAIVCWQPYASEIRSRMGDTVVAWPAQSEQLTHGVVVARNDWIERNPQLAARFIASLDEAAEYTVSHPAESRAIVRDRMNLSDSYLAVAWPENRFSLSLDQSLIIAMEDEARWMIANNLTNTTAIPDFRAHIDTAALEQVRPDAVRIIG